MAKIRNRKLNKKKIVFFILLIIIGTYCVSNIMDYKVIKLDKNSNYSGIGQEKIKNKVQKQENKENSNPHGQIMNTCNGL